MYLVNNVKYCGMDGLLLVSVFFFVLVGIFRGGIEGYRCV